MRESKVSILAWAVAWLALAAGAGAATGGGEEILLRVKNAGSLSKLIDRYGLVLLASTPVRGDSDDDSDRNDLYRLQVPAGKTAADVLAAMASDNEVLNTEPNARAALPSLVPLDQSSVSVLNQSTVSVLNQSTVDVLNSLLNVTPTTFYGSTVTAGYVNQRAMKIINNDPAHALSTGTGVLIADIDNGVDPRHPAYQSALVPGFNFLNNSSDVSIFTGLNQSTVDVLNQSTVSVLNQSTVSVLNQSTVSVLNQSTVDVLNSLPPFFGHGTEVAGILHLVAPRSSIMPLKAFGADGTGALFDVVRALNYAVDNGARVVNMSFSCDCMSKELKNAIKYAARHGVLLVGSVGNDSAMIRLFPASYEQVMGIAATNFDDTRAAFSNYGSSVYVAAPGAGVITTFPGGRYAAVWGTSFSAPMVTGEAALLLERGDSASRVRAAIAGTAVNNNQGNTQGNTDNYLGFGRIDLLKSLSF